MNYGNSQLAPFSFSYQPGDNTFTVVPRVLEIAVCHPEDEVPGPPRETEPQTKESAVERSALRACHADRFVIGPWVLRR